MVEGMGRKKSFCWMLGEVVMVVCHRWETRGAVVRRWRIGRKVRIRERSSGVVRT